MPEQKSATHRVTVYSDDHQFSDAVANALGLDSSLRVVVAPMAAFCDGTHPDSAADSIILDVDRGQYFADQQLFEARRLLSPVTPVIVVSNDLPENRFRDIVRLRAVDWLRKSISRRDLLDAVLRSLEKQERAGTVTAIVSAVGGTGASTMAMNAAHIVVNPTRKAPKEQTAMLFELDFSAGSCGYFLDIHNDYDFRNVLENPRRIDGEFVDIIKKQHPSGFSLLSLKAPILQFHPSGEEIVLRMLDVMTLQYDHLIVDVPYYQTSWKSSVLEAVTNVILVTEPIIPALRQARDLADGLEEIRSGASVSVIVNKQGRGLFSRDLSKTEIERVFGGRAVEFLPEAKAQLVEAANRGIIPIALDGRSAYSRASRKFLERFV